MTKAWAILLTATCLSIGGGIDHALAFSIPAAVAPIADSSVMVINCKQGGKNCTTLSRAWQPGKKKPTIGGCTGSTNETCGYTTHAMTHHSTVISQHPSSGKSH
jgi:hypothetical protein